MSMQRFVAISLIVVSHSSSCWGTDVDPAFREAKQTFQVQMRKKIAAERISGVDAIAGFMNNETADLLVKQIGRAHV